MVTKDNVRNWLGRCQRRALKSVTEKWVYELLTTLDDELATIYLALNKLDSDAKTINAQIKEIADVSDISINKYCGWNMDFEGMDNNLKKVLSLVKEGNAVKSIFDEFRAEYESVKQEYHNLIIKCGNMKAQTSVNYLQEIGFDTSTLATKESEPDKSKLFVCGDNKPNA